ncbi:MAG: tetratricopeptide repeat protein [Nostoc sp. NMS1]|uniref:tetratricopeptide repeat protein n=1 Tax=Nostoc sp. NMS1 TaxID=2815388 RepID=UPI0025D6128A|nr:tetratricopeptide repeat protein [Nostoc sp. NMS1]MBN3906743.1 tetratricopeptide repeat protein [Nostoc sp. NMS1]
MPDSQDPKEANNNDLRNAQFAGGFVNADKVIAGQIGGDVYNINIDFNQQIPTEVKNIVDRIEPILERLQEIHQPESPGVVKAGNPGKSLAYWQGRESEITQIQQLLTDENTFLIGIEGIGGIGKSMLAAKIYNQIAGFPKRFWANVSNGASFTDLARQVLTEFGFRVPEQETQLVEALVKCLRSEQFLLIIDNLESVLQRNRQWGSLFYGDFFQAWVEFGGNSKVLVTTRERPELKGFEWLLLRGLKVKEGVALLTALGIRGDLAEFVELVDGHPLLLRLVADLLKQEYAKDPDLKRLAGLGLGNLRQLLTDPKVKGVHRRENVGIVLVLDASFNRLNELQKALLQNISVYRGVFDSAAAVAVLPGNLEPEIEEELRNLAKRSLLEEKLNGKRRFEFQPVILEYVRYKAGEQTEAHQRAIDYYRSIAKQTPWTTKDDVQEYLEIFHHCYELQDYNSAFDALWVCNDFLSLRGYYIDKVELYGQLVSNWAEIGDKENWKYGASLTSLGNAYKSLGEYQQAIEFHQQSLAIARKIGDRQLEGQSLNNLGIAHRLLAKYQSAMEFQQQSLEITREIGDRSEEARALRGLGNTCSFLGQYQRAIELQKQSLEIAREIGDRQGEGNSLNNLGNAFECIGYHQQAIEFYHQSLEIKREIGDRSGEANTLGNLGNIYYKLGQCQRAIEFLQQSLKIVKKINNPKSEHTFLNDLGNAYYKLGAYQLAIEFHQQSLEIAREIGDRLWESACLNNLGNCYTDLGQYQLAIEFFQQSLQIKRDIGDIRGKANAWFNLGRALEMVNRKLDALDAYRNAHKLYQTMGLNTPVVPDCNFKIQCLSQPKTPLGILYRFFQFLVWLWRGLHSWFRR